MAGVLSSVTHGICAAGCVLVAGSGMVASPVAQETVTVQVPARPMPWDGVPSEFQFLFRRSIAAGSLDATWAGLPFDSITLTRTPCYGTCPAYSVTFSRARLNGKRSETYEDRFGRAELHVTRAGRDSDQYRRFPTATGEFTGWVDIWTFGRLSYLIQRADFDRLENRYPVASDVTDASSATVSVNGPGIARSVEVTAGMGPIELWAIQEAIDSAAKSINWKQR